jgi:hypothetical protein
VALVLLGGCGIGTTAATSEPSRPVATQPGPSIATELPATPTPPPPTATAAPRPPLTASVRVTPVKEPNDHAHRNYCGSGATQVLTSAWLPAVPDIERVAQLSHLDPNSGQTGADTVVAINTLLAPVVRARLGGDVYSGRHTVQLDDVVAALLHDLPNARLIASVGHGAPIMVQTMTQSLPGWNHWQATHMITVFAYDLRSGDPATETVSYAETPSLMAAYTGPPTQTITLAALWSAMLEHNTDAPSDPINLIS